MAFDISNVLLPQLLCAGAAESPCSARLTSRPNDLREPVFWMRIVRNSRSNPVSERMTGGFPSQRAGLGSVTDPCIQKNASRLPITLSRSMSDDRPPEVLLLQNQRLVAIIAARPASAGGRRAPATSHQPHGRLRVGAKR